MKLAGCVVLSLLALAGSAIQAGSQTKTNSNDVVAEVSGEKLTVNDLERVEGGKLLQARYQFYVNQRHALDDLIEEELLSIEARKQHMTVDQLLDAQVYKGITDPTEDQLKVYYEGMESDESYEAIRDRILEHIRDTRRTKARANYIRTLKAQASVQVLLEPPSADVKVENAYITGGPATAPVVLVEFADYECPYCEKANPQLHKLQTEFGSQLAVVYKDFPLPMHHHSQKAAEAARCAGEQGKFWEYHDVLFYSRQLDIADLKEHARVLKLDGNRFDECLDSGSQAEAVKKDLEEGKKLGLGGTPSIFVNGHFVNGAQDYNALRDIVQQQLSIAYAKREKREPSQKTASGTGQ